MAENNGINGDTMTNNSSFKENSEKYNTSFDPNEICPLRTEQEKEAVYLNKGNSHVQINMTEASSRDTFETLGPQAKGKDMLKGTYAAILTHLDLSKKARVPFFIMTLLCAIMLIVLIIMIALWPYIPFYMKEAVCTERECLESSSQVLLWGNTNVDVCNNPYEWACGKFKDEYTEHLELDSYDVTGGEWDIRSRADYEDISKIYAFIAQMPVGGLRTSAQTLLKGLHTSCMTESTDQKSTPTLKEAIFSAHGWVLEEDFQPNAWNYKEAIVKLISNYGIFPFLKVSVENRNSPPYGNIVKISEGEYGLPHKMFYNLSPDHEIIRAYKLFLRDFAILMDITSEKAMKFSDEVFHFEKRIVNSLPEKRTPTILSLDKIQDLARSLPIIEIITATFPKLNDDTKVLVEDVQMIKTLSAIAGTTDEGPLNNFLTWSLSRHFLPFMSRKFRAAWQTFNSKIYGHERSQPPWYHCSKAIRDWFPFAIDAFRQNPRLIVASTPINYTTICKCISIENNGTEVDHTNLDYLNLKHVDIRISSGEKNGSAKVQNENDRISEKLVQDRSNYNHELLKMIFYHMKHLLKQSIMENVAIDEDVTEFINTKLAEMKLQIGIPADLLQNNEQLNKYYRDFYWMKLHFIDNIAYLWSFRKKKMELMLDAMNVTDKTIANSYILSRENNDQLIKYSIDLNTIIVSSRAADKPIFHYKYPISVNFARTGMELAKILLDAVFIMGEQFKNQFYESNTSVNKTQSDFSLGDTLCLETLCDTTIPEAAKHQLVSEVTSGRFTAKCLKKFLRLIDLSQPIPDTTLAVEVTYDMFDLNRRKRQPALREYDDMQLFSLVYLQRFCSVDNGHYKRYKPFVEMEMPVRDRFNINWDQISLLKNSMDCSVTKKQCEEIV